MHTGSRRRVPALDSVRAIAITCVLLRHAWPSIFPAAGFGGVELFFVLSGFLITTILISDEQAGVLSFKRFYFNRMLRLYPALIAVLIGLGLVVGIIDPLDDRKHLISGLVLGLTYTTDIPKMPLRALTEATHLWTLAIEEQFYIFWPVVLIAFARRNRLRAFAWGALLISAGAMVLTVLRARHHASHGVLSAYTWPTTWAVTLTVGSLLATRAVRPRDSRPVGWIGLVGVTALCFVPNAKSAVYGYLLVLPATAALGLLIIANAASDNPLPFLLHPWLRYIGRISYAIYLWDYPIAQWISGPAAIPLSIVAASLSFYLIEAPVSRLRRGPQAMAAARNTVADIPELGGRDVQPICPSTDI